MPLEYTLADIANAAVANGLDGEAVERSISTIVDQIAPGVRDQFASDAMAALILANVYPQPDAIADQAFVYAASMMQRRRGS